MNSTGTQIVSPVGRIVWGHPTKLKEKQDPQTRQTRLKQDGTPMMESVFGLAIPKDQFAAIVWPAMHAEASKGYPNGVPQNFAWKYDDGDDASPRTGSKPFNEREGYPGCYVLTIASNTGFPPNCFRFNPATGGYVQLTEEQINTGDYVAVALNFVVNVPTQRTHTPSLYVNPQAVEHVGYGTPIVSAGVDPMTAFGGQQRQLPPGASATPLSASGGTGMPGTAPQPQPGQMPGGAPQPGNVQGGYPAPMGGGVPQAMPGGSAPAGMPGNGGMMPPTGQNAPTGAYPSNPAQPGQMPGGAPVYGGAPAHVAQPGQMPPPAQDFTQNAGYQPQPQYAPQPGQMPGGAPQMAPQPGQMPGMMPPR